MATSSASGGIRNFTVIRATPAQTAVLMQEFAISDTPSAEKLKALSDQTSLPSKWLHNWFGRQRTKANKSKPKAAPKPYTGTYALDPVMTPQELLRIKLEQADIDVMSTSSSMIEVSSISEYASVSVSSSGILEASEESEPPRKRRGRPPQNRNSPARTLRSHKRKDLATSANTQASGVRSEPINNASTEDEFGTRLVLSGNDSSDHTKMAMPYSQLMPNVAPPKRSPMTAPKKTIGSRSRNARSNLSVNNPESIYARMPTGDFALDQGAVAYNNEAKTRYARTKKSQKIINPSAAFHSQFQNNVPENFAAPRLLPSAPFNTFYTGDIMPDPMPVSEASQSVAHHAQPSDAVLYNQIVALAPAFDWNNYAPPSEDAAMSSNHGVVPHALESHQYLEESAYTNYVGCDQLYYDQHPAQEDMPRTELAPIQPLPEIIDTMLLDPLKDAINPSLAPLKHLTDILHRFKDEQGTYARLLAYEEGDNVKKCLLDANLASNDPFQGSMALALLSKLGFEWEY